MRLFYAAVGVGIASLVGAIAAAFAREWLLAGILLGVWAAYCVIAPRLAKRIPEERMRRQSRMAEQMIGAVGRAQSAGWTPKRKRPTPK